MNIKQHILGLGLGLSFSLGLSHQALSMPIKTVPFTANNFTATEQSENTDLAFKMGFLACIFYLENPHLYHVSTSNHAVQRLTDYYLVNLTEEEKYIFVDRRLSQDTDFKEKSELALIRCLEQI